jgi:hypothetical protein
LTKIFVVGDVISFLMQGAGKSTKQLTLDGPDY